MKQNIKDFLFNLLISMCIGLLVGIIQVIIINIDGETVKELIMFSIIGGVIGTISRLVFIYMIEIKQRNVIVGFISVFIVIGVISCIPSFYDYFIDHTRILPIKLISILITAELLGMSFCYYSYKRYLAFNSKLMNKKRQLITRKTNI